MRDTGGSPRRWLCPGKKRPAGPKGCTATLPPLGCSLPSNHWEGLRLSAKAMQQRLSLSLSEMRSAYDVVVVGSGYGGGVAASRLSRAGRSVCVIEKGKEFPTGTFPSRLPELRRELQLNGGKMRSGSRTGLFDFRLGADIHVLVGCGLGGGSLINAGVALKPDPRVFADPTWPEEIVSDGLLAL